MHEAFLPICLLRNYPYALECLTCYDNFLLVGTKQGLLLVYEITPKSLTHPVYFIPSINPRPISKKTVRLSLRNDILEQPEAPDPHALPAAAPIFSTRVHTTRTFGRKPILQLAAIPELDLLLALAEGQMNVYQLQNCQLIATVPTSKGATVFAYYYSLGKDLVENQSCLSGSDSGTSHNPSSYFTGAKLYICVGVKRRLFFWRWDFLGQKCVRPGGPEDRLSCDWSPELTLSDTARVMQFQGPTHLIVGTRAEYCQVTLSTGESRSIAYPGRNQLPLLSFLSGCFRASTPDPSLQCILNPEQRDRPPPDPFSEASSLSGRILHFGRSSSPSSMLSATINSFDDDPMLLGVGRDDTFTAGFISGDLNSMAKIRWTSVPYQIYVYPPYIIGAMDTFLEVRVADPCELIQQLPVARVRAFCHNGGWFFAATAPHSTIPTESSKSDQSAHSSPLPTRSYDAGAVQDGSGNEVWLLLSANRTTLVEKLIGQKEFDLALLLSKQAASLVGQCVIETRQIVILYACHLYQQQEFGRSLQLFAQQLVDPAHVLGLFPDLVSGPFDSSTIRYPISHLSLDHDQFCEAAEPIITYLLTWRRLIRQSLTFDRCRLVHTTPEGVRHLRSTSAASPTKDVTLHLYPITDNSETITSAQKQLEIIDTALLKCYLATNTARVAPLLRQTNSCHLAESERTLAQHFRYQDLIMLYQSHGLHSKALSVLHQFGLLRLKRLGHIVTLDHPIPSDTNCSDTPSVAVDPERADPVELASLGRPQRTVHYLQSLGPFDFDLVVRYADWVMRYYPTVWMRIFVAWERHFVPGRQSAAAESGEPRREKRAHSLAYRSQVVRYLEKEAAHLIIPFLESLIFTSFDIDSESGDEDFDCDMLSNATSNERLQPENTDYRSQSTAPDDSAAKALHTGQHEHHAHEVSADFSISPSVDTDRATAIRESLWRLPGCKQSKDNSEVVDPDKFPPIPQRGDDADPTELHTLYASALIERVQAIQPVGVAFACRVSDEQPKSGPVARLRRRLLRFLNHPGATYSPRKLLDKCPYDALFEERTLLLAKLNFHDQALTLWIHVLDDWTSAISHCLAVHELLTSNSTEPSSLPPRCTSRNELNGTPTTHPLSFMSNPRLAALSRSPAQDSIGFGPEFASPSTSRKQTTSGSQLDIAPSRFAPATVERDIFFLLIQICMQPPEPAALGIIVPGREGSACFTPKPQLALEVIHRFGEILDVVKVLRVLDGFKLCDISDYLKTAFLRQESTRTHLAFLSSAARAELSASRLVLVHTTKQQFLVSATTRCRTCRRRIESSAFVRHPCTGELEHYGCCRSLSGRK